MEGMVTHVDNFRSHMLPVHGCIRARLKVPAERQARTLTRLACFEKQRALVDWSSSGELVCSAHMITNTCSFL
jgi:hypothetical protein